MIPVSKKTDFGFIKRRIIDDIIIAENIFINQQFGYTYFNTNLFSTSSAIPLQKLMPTNPDTQIYKNLIPALEQNV